MEFFGKVLSIILLLSIIVTTWWLLNTIAADVASNSLYCSLFIICSSSQPTVIPCKSLLNVTGPGKTGLIYTKYTCLYYGTYLLFCMCYPQSVTFIEFFMDFCIYDDILHTIQIADKNLLHFKLSKSGQIWCVDKTCVSRPGHKSIQHFVYYQIHLLSTYSNILTVYYQIHL